MQAADLLGWQIVGARPAAPAAQLAARAEAQQIIKNSRHQQIHEPLAALRQMTIDLHILHGLLWHT